MPHVTQFESLKVNITKETQGLRKAQRLRCQLTVTMLPSLAFSWSVTAETLEVRSDVRSVES